MMAIIVICLCVCLAVGPIMMMQPSQRERGLANLRDKAYQRGFRVRFSAVGDIHYVLYECPWQRSPDRQWLHRPWNLVQKNFEHEVHFWQRWDWAPNSHAPPALFTILLQELAKLPEGVTSVSVSEVGIALAWDERGGAARFEVLADWLESNLERFEKFQFGSDSDRETIKL